MSEALFQLRRGSTPLLISLPHVGTQIPAGMQADFVAGALRVDDTDWHLESLYDFAAELGASALAARHSRYVIDLNRSPFDAPMYAGQNNTGLCPTRSFGGEALYRSGREPDAREIERRREVYWRPYHEALAAELQRLRAAHGHALLLDGHSIRSHLPWLFEGKLPDLNLGTAGGQSCAPGLRAALGEVLAGAAQYPPHFTHAVDGRFRGGYITRHYGQPALGVHAVQLEMCWSCYMREEPPYAIDEARALFVRPVLRELAATMLAWGAQYDPAIDAGAPPPAGTDHGG
jgi:N-formylglutamate deformylase